MRNVYAYEGKREQEQPVDSGDTNGVLNNDLTAQRQIYLGRSLITS